MCGISRSAARGVTLVELVVFIVIVGVAMAGVFAAFNTMTAASADPQVRKQMLAIAESLMEEIQLQPFTFCDPDDANAATATNSSLGAGGCATLSEDTVIGPENCPGASCETRYTTPQFDNVSDYHGFPMSGINDITNNPISGLGGYSASVTITQAGLGSGANAIAAADALLISITVSPPAGAGQQPVTLDGYRTRYAPNTLP